jgi:conjugal transfer pilus assembly protein TraV
MRTEHQLYRPTAWLGLLLATSGCASLGGNVRGNFSCQAPTGDCAPTSVIDGRAIEAAGANAHGLPPQQAATTASASGSLKVVLTAYRDAQGRNHAARVVEVPLPEPTGSHFQDPASRRDVARALARAVAEARQPESQMPPVTDDITHDTNTALPDVLTAPLQHVPAGGPGTASLQTRVPHTIEGQEEPAPQQGQEP